MAFQIPVPEVSVKDLKQRFDKGTTPVILDVREPHELAIAALPTTSKTIHIPVNQIPTRIQELEPYKNEEIVVYCRSGGRSAMAASFLQQNGFKTVKNLTGGVLAWSAEIDPSVPQY